MPEQLGGDHHLDTHSQIERRLSLIRDATNKLNIEIDPEYASDPHFWFLIGNSAAKLNIGFPSNVPKDKRQQYVLQQAVNFSREIYGHKKDANIDSLTGIPNRNFLDAYLRRISNDRLIGSSIGIVFIDVDHFKLINDVYGHEVGDKTLQVIASTLTQNVRNFDLVARYGGEEMVIVLNELNSLNNGSRDSLFARIDTIREVISSQVKSTVERSTQKIIDRDITASFGISYIDDIQIEPFIALNQADANMYEAKKAGRNKVCDGKIIFPINPQVK